MIFFEGMLLGMEKPETARVVREIRKKLGLTQAQLAEKVGVARYNITKYERGATIPPGDVLLKILQIKGDWPK